MHEEREGNPEGIALDCVPGRSIKRAAGRAALAQASQWPARRADGAGALRAGASSLHMDRSAAPGLRAALRRLCGPAAGAKRQRRAEGGGPGSTSAGVSLDAGQKTCNSTQPNGPGVAADRVFNLGNLVGGCLVRVALPHRAPGRSAMKLTLPARYHDALHHLCGRAFRPGRCRLLRLARQSQG